MIESEQITDDYSGQDGFPNVPIATKDTIVMVGLMGAGKTAIGRRLAGRLELPFVDADDEIEAAARYMAAFLDQAEPEPPRDGLPAAELLKLVVEDVKAFYVEAALAQPGQGSSEAAAESFWGDTEAGRIMLALHPVLAGHADKEMRFLAQWLLVPRAQLHRLAEKPPV